MSSIQTICKQYLSKSMDWKLGWVTRGRYIYGNKGLEIFYYLCYYGTGGCHKMNWVVVDGWMKLRKNTKKEWRETYIEVDCYWILVVLFPLVHFKTKWIYRFNLFIIILLNNNNRNRKVMIFDCFTTVFMISNNMKYVVSSHSVIACFLIVLLFTTCSQL